MAVNPRQPSLKEGGYSREEAAFGDFSILARYFATKKIRYSLSSPPLIKDVPEGELILCKSENRIYITVDGVLKYWSLT